MSWIITGTEKTPLDQDYRNVSLLLHGDGADGSTTIVDSSPTPKTVTAVGNVQISTAQSKFGGSSIAFDSQIANNLTSTSNEFIFGAGDFTIEAWIRLNSDPFPDFPTIVRLDTQLYFNFRASTFFAITSATQVYAGSPSGAPVNQWFHVAATRHNGLCRVFLDGISGTPVVFSNNFTTPSLNIGNGGASSPFDGYIDDLRITKGVARYTANFTPPTAPFPDAGPAQ